MAARLLNSSLKDLVGEGWIGPVYCEGCEILRRIFITVRDRNWQEIRPTQFASVIDENKRTMRLIARHTSDLVDFEWQGELNVSEDGRELRFAFKGEALRDMDVCRLGLIVLHPVESMIGSRVTASGGQIEQTLTIKSQLAPQPIIDGIPGAMTEPFTRLAVEREDWGQLLLSFDGDAFELEDQRNWGDASLKTYCTPLRNGFPRRVDAGTVVAHSVEAQFTSASTQAHVCAPGSRDALDSVRQSLPAIGRAWRGVAGDESVEDEVWDHVHIDLGAHDLATLRALVDVPRTPWIQFGLEAKDQGIPTEWLALLRECRERTCRVLLYGPGSALPSAAALVRCCAELARSVAAGTSLLAATRGYFVEFNRAVPLDAPVAGIAFPLTATVHSDDEETIMGNVATIRDIADTARHLTSRPEVVLAPLALYYPRRATCKYFPGAILVPWLKATLRHAATAGVTSITLGEDVLDAVQSTAGPRALHLLLESAGQGQPSS